MEDAWGQTLLTVFDSIYHRTLTFGNQISQSDPTDPLRFDFAVANNVGLRREQFRQGCQTGQI
jgi:hypothetical protein